MVAQSIAFATAPRGGPVLAEDAPLYVDAPDATWALTVQAVAALERTVLDAADLAPVVLRYGSLYGQYTLYDASGAIGQAVHLGRLPLVGDGAGLTSFVTVRDAALATVLAVGHPATGVFNIVDDAPAPAHSWLPGYADLLGAPEPKRIPVDLGERPARLVRGLPADPSARRLQRQGPSGARLASDRADLGRRHLPGPLGGRAVRICVIGAGPRGTSVLERIIANRAARECPSRCTSWTRTRPARAGCGAPASPARC